MKLYNSPISPFGARISIAMRAKGITLEDIGLPTTGLKSPEFLAVNPVGKIPVLVCEDGTIIPESEAILRYLEDRFPTPSLLPEAPEQRAQVNTVIRILDGYVMAPVIRLFPHLDPSMRDIQTVDAEVARWKEGLAALAHFMAKPLPRAAAGITVADCVLPPSLHLSALIATMLGLGNLHAPHAALADYQASMCTHPIVGKVLDELSSAQAEH